LPRASTTLIKPTTAEDLAHGHRLHVRGDVEQRYPPRLDGGFCRPGVLWAFRDAAEMPIREVPSIEHV
jgi:hypothetical protein